MKHLLIALAILAPAATVMIASDIKLDGVKCIVTGESVNASVSSDYMGGKVYFCCPSCQTGFKADTAKYATKANHQLVATGQAVQTSCPITGEPISRETFIELNGAKVYFCCDSCKNQVTKVSEANQMTMLFGEAAWKKAGFKVGN